MEISAKRESFSSLALALKGTASARAIKTRHEDWQARLPDRPAALWDALTALDTESRASLFAHCAALTVNVAEERWNRRPNALAHGEQLARTVGLDMVAAGWKPTADNYLGRVPKARILEAVREGRDERSAQLIGHLKKGEMAKEAERLLDESGWLPEPLRPADTDSDEPGDREAGEAADLPEFLAGDDGGEDVGEAADEEELLAAE